MGGLTVTTSRSWNDPDLKFKIMEGVLNFMMVEWRFKPHNYGAIVMLRVLHEYRYFAGTETGTPK